MFKSLLRFSGTALGRITKSDAAIAQLNTAIKLYFEDSDHISAHTLVRAADTIVHDLCVNKFSIEGKYSDSWRGELEILIKDEHHKEFFSQLNHPSNFFKHARNDSDQILEGFKPEMTELAIFGTIMGLHKLGIPFTWPMQCFMHWFTMLNPKILKNDTPFKQKAITMRASTKSLNKQDFLKIGRVILEKGPVNTSTLQEK